MRVHGVLVGAYAERADCGRGVVLRVTSQEWTYQLLLANLTAEHVTSKFFVYLMMDGDRFQQEGEFTIQAGHLCLGAR